MHSSQIARRAMVLPFLLALVGALGGCNDDPLGPFQPEIGNYQDSFQFQATNVSNVSTTLVYAWNNSGTRATIDHSTTTTGGSTLLTIKDAGGTTVYSKALVPSLNEPTPAGAAGSWSVTLVLTNYSGTINFRVQKL